MTWEGKIINRYLQGNEGQVREQTQEPKASCSLATLLSAGKQSCYDSPERRKDSPDPRPHKEMTSVPSMAGKSFLGRGCQETKNSPINAMVTFHYRPITHWFPMGGERRTAFQAGSKTTPLIQPKLRRSRRGLRKKIHEAR